MTVESTTTKIRYEGNSQATRFPTLFVFAHDEHVRAVVRSLAAATDSGYLDTPLTLGTDYSLEGAGTGLSGTLVYPLSGTPLPEGHTLTIYSDVAITQEKAWNNLDAIDTTEIEKADDKLTRICLQLKEELGRCIKLPVAAPTPETDINPEDLFAVRDSALAARDSALISEAHANTSASVAAEDALNAATAAVNAAALSEAAAAAESSAAASAQLATSAASAAFGAAASAYDPTINYDFPDVVAGPDGHTYRAISPVQGQEPGSGSEIWTRLTLDVSPLFDQDMDGDVIFVG
ncbi:hypothetical protein [Desulfovibrio ferrophilus]|uniref:Uncharacterized protein n=1 Tax=Desulfovibrio ferrophilus TaxID=241368 RepID=A0A2Z6B276_9BACT|nr:hypothetical protein [Desulfovibrio ferrophilus]BBD09604.1 uncharacterized protein DFE_2878 [Desulfovibrio ferrophilus]